MTNFNFNFNFVQQRALQKLQQVKDEEFVGRLRYKMSVAHAVYMLFDKEKVVGVETKDFICRAKKINFSKNLFKILKESGFVGNDLLPNTAKKLLLNKLDEFYGNLAN